MICNDMYSNDQKKFSSLNSVLRNFENVEKLVVVVVVVAVVVVSSK